MENKKLKGIYLGAYTAYHPDHDIVYQDINGKRDLGGDMLDIDLTPYDYIIATPPCNWYSRARRGKVIKTDYAERTKHLLPCIMRKLERLGKPYIVENVLNRNRVPEGRDLNYKWGGHNWWTNVPLQFDNLEKKPQRKRYLQSKDRQGGHNVHVVIEMFINTVECGNYLFLVKE